MGVGEVRRGAPDVRVLITEQHATSAPLGLTYLHFQQI